MTSPDRRSVGELLADCDRATRELLHDPLDLNSAALIQAWPEVVQAAHDLLDILPTPPTPPGRSPQVAAAGSDVTGERLHLISAAVHNRLHGAPWPGTCPADERLVAVADDLVRAHDLIHRRWRDTAPLTPEVLADAAAARTRVLHSVYVTTHAVRLAVTRALQDKPSGPRSRARVAIHRSAALRDTAARLDTAERIAGTALHRTFPHALTGERRDPPTPERVPQALAAWDVAAHRGLAHHPSLATVFEVTRVHAATLALTRPILNAAATSDQIDHDVFAAQLDTQLAAGSAAWHTLHGVVRDLIEPGSRRMDPALRIAGSELLASLSEIVLDGTTIATPAAIIMRATPETVPALTEALATHHEMSAVVLDTLTHPGLRVDARAAQDYLHASVAFATDSDVGSPSRAWIDPHDLAARRQISLPQPLRADLCRLAHQANATTASLAESPAVRPARAQTPGPAESCSPARLRFPRLTAAPPRGPQAVTRSR